MRCAHPLRNGLIHASHFRFSVGSKRAGGDLAFSLVRKGDASGIERGRDIIGEKPKGISITSVHFARHFGA